MAKSRSSTRIAHLCRSRVGNYVFAIASYIAGLHLESDTVIDGVSLCLLHLHHEILLIHIAKWICRRNIDLIEDTEVVELSLRIENTRLAHRIAFLDFELPTHNQRLGVPET